MNKLSIVTAFTIGACTLLGAQTASAQTTEVPGYSSLAGKTVVYIPIAMNYSLTQAWYAGMVREAERFGYEIIVRDPNWDANASIQAFQAAIRDQPDLIVTLPTDTTSISRLITKAQNAGIPVIEMQQLTSVEPDIYIGAEYHSIGRENAMAAVAACGDGSGRSGKISLVTGVTTAPAAISWEAGVLDVLTGRDDVTIVSTQAANWDASRSHAITSTALQQHSDLCAVLDMWDGQATGSASAIREAGLTGTVFLATAGGGDSSACDAIEEGAFSSYVSFDAATQTSYLNAMIKAVLQSDRTPGESVTILYPPQTAYTKDNLPANACWTLEDMEVNGG